MSDPDKILVVGHDVVIPRAAERKLAKAGFIVLRGDPSQFRTIDTMTLMQSDLIFDAALAMIGDAEQRHRDFGKEIAGRLRKARGVS